MARVIVVDDSPQALEMAGVILRQAGHDVMLCGEARDVVRLLEQQVMDALVTDIYMPGMDGLELIQRVRHIRPSTAIIAMDGDAPFPSMLSVAKCLGASCTVQKPFLAADLVNTINKALAGQTSIPAPEDATHLGVGPLGNPGVQRGDGGGRCG